MADTGENTAAAAESGAAIVSEQLTALLLKDMDADTADTSAASEYQETSKLDPTSTTPFDVGGRGNEENTPPPNRRPLFGSMREALESSGQVKEEPGGYVIKHHSGRPQQFRSSEVVPRSKYRHAKQRSGKDTLAAAFPCPEDEADAAGYTVIRRRSSCDESSSSRASASASSAPSHSSGTGRRNPRASTPARFGGKKQQQQQQQRPRRGSMSALPSSSLRASVAVPGFQPLRPPPGLTQAASGWVVKAAAPAERANKIEEPPVEALWPEMKSTGKTPSGWAASATSESGGLQAQAWPAPTSSSAAAAEQEQEEDGVDLLARLGVTL